MKVLTIICLTFLTAISAYAEDPPTPSKAPVEAKNEIILIPTLHRGHLRKGEFYNLERLASIIKEVKVDFICTEITPTALATHRDGKEDRRLNFFPEFTQVILKLEKKLGYEVIPCSAWTAKRNYKTIGLKAMDEAHYKLIGEALDKYSKQKKRIAITFGGGHINGLLEHLRKRDDIKIIDYRPTLKKQKEEHLKSK